MAIIKLGGEIIKVSYLSNLTNETNKIIRRNIFLKMCKSLVWVIYILIKKFILIFKLYL